MMRSLSLTTSVMNWLIKLLCPTRAWKIAADELGGRYVPGHLWGFGHGSIEIPNGDHPITIAGQIGSDEYAGGESSASGYFTRVTVPIQITAADRFALLHGDEYQWGFVLISTLASKLNRTLDSVSQTLKRDVPDLGEDWILLGKNKAVAMDVLGDRGLVDLLRHAPNEFIIIVGGRSVRSLEGFAYSHMKTDTPSDVFILAKGIVTETQWLAWMINVARALLDALHKAGCMEVRDTKPSG